MRKIFLIAVSVLFTHLSFGQEVLSLQECRKRAVAHNKELQQTRYQKAETQAHQKSARTSYLPAFNANVSLTHLFLINDIELLGGGAFLPTAESEQAALNGNFSGTSDVWSPGMSINSDNLSIVYSDFSLSQPVYMGGKIKHINKQADAAVEIAEYSLDLKYAEIIELTDRAFWDVVMIKATIDVAERYTEMLLELEEQMNDMYEVGLQPASEKLKVNVRKNEVALDLIRARNQLKIAKIRLNQVLGQDLNTSFEVDYPGTMSSQLASLEQGVEQALANRAELKVLEKQLAISEYEKKVINSDYLPQLGVNASYFSSYDNINESVIHNPMIAAQLTIPVFHWGQAKYKQQAAELAVKQNRTEIEKTSDLVNLEVLSTKVEIEEAYEVILVAEKSIKQAQESLEEVTASFEVGLNTTSDLLSAQADWQNANVQWIKANAQYNFLTTKWQRVTGELVPGEMD